MKILLIHKADPHTSNLIKLWRKKRTGLGDFYQLSLLGELEENIELITSQIERAETIYSIEKIIIFSKTQLPLGDSISEVEYITNF